MTKYNIIIDGVPFIYVVILYVLGAALSFSRALATYNGKSTPYYNNYYTIWHKKMDSIDKFLTIVFSLLFWYIIAAFEALYCISDMFNKGSNDGQIRIIEKK